MSTEDIDEKAHYASLRRAAAHLVYREQTLAEALVSHGLKVKGNFPIHNVKMIDLPDDALQHFDGVFRLIRRQREWERDDLRLRQNRMAKSKFYELKGLPPPVAKIENADEDLHYERMSKIYKDLENVDGQPCAVCSNIVDRHKPFVPGLEHFGFWTPWDNKRHEVLYWIHHKSCNETMYWKIHQYQEEITKTWRELQNKQKEMRSRRYSRPRKSIRSTTL